MPAERASPSSPSHGSALVRVRLRVRVKVSIGVRVRVGVRARVSKVTVSGSIRSAGSGASWS